MMIFYVCYIIFLQRETFFVSNRWFLIVGLVTAILFPILVIPIYVEVAPPSLDTFTMIATTSQNIPESFDWTLLLHWIYGIGTSFFVGRLIIQLISLVTLIKKNDQEQNGHFTYVKTNQDTTPFSFFKWIVYNPKQFNPKELELILKHEKVHAKQMHSLDVLLMDLISALFWFNPFIWPYRKALKQNLEFIADHNTQKQSDCEERYQKLLLKTSLPQQNLALINTFYNSTIRLKISGKQIVLFSSFGQVKKRILMLHQSKSNLMNTWKYTVVVPLMVMFAMSFNTQVIAKTADQASETIITDQQNILKFVITKNSTDNELDLIKNKLAERAVIVIFKNVKRNSNNEITAIKIKSEFQGQKNVHYSKLSEPIRPIEITFNPSTNAIHIKQRTLVSNQSSNDELSLEDFNSTAVQVTSGKTELNNNDLIKALIIADGKEITKQEMKAIDPNSIQSIFILKDKNVIKEYGEKGKDGVIVMTLKKEFNFLKNDAQEIISNHNKDFKFKTDKVNLTNPESDDKNSQLFKKEDQKITVSRIIEISPLFILDGKEISKNEFETIDRNTIASVDVLKDESATKKYGEQGKNGVIIITSKKDKVEKNDINSALYIIDGKEMTTDQMQAITPDMIESMDVLKDESATKKYGVKGKKGVILIKLKKE